MRRGQYNRLCVLAFILAVPAELARAASVTITCATADALSGGGPMTITFEGDASGTVTIVSSAINFSLPAKREVRSGDLDGKPHSVTGITGVAQRAFAMPDRAALEACATKSVPPDFKDDAGMLANSVLNCVKSTPLAAAPVPAVAAISIALVPGDGGAVDVVVEVKRTYLEKSSLTGGALSIETFPGQCVLAK